MIEKAIARSDESSAAAPGGRAPVNRQVILAALPEGPLVESHFAAAESSVGTPGPGQVLVRNILLSIDPANRAWMQARTYRDQLRPGNVVAGFSVGEVTTQNGTDLPVGAIVACQGGWQEYVVLPAAEVEQVEVLDSLRRDLGLLGITGQTAYVGLLCVGRPAPGETVVVSAAAGATGHVVGQLARIHGCRVVGITGSDEKNAILTDRLGFDAVVNHRSESLDQDLRAACPDGVDVYFDNVGGPLLETMLRRMNVGGRIVCCGVVSQYDTASPSPGPRGVPGLLITKRLRMEGFLLPDFAEELPEARRRLAEWAKSGDLIGLDTEVEGLERAPQALIDLLAGRTIGKTMVRLAPDPVAGLGTSSDGAVR